MMDLLLLLVLLAVATLVALVMAARLMRLPPLVAQAE
jgi:hypothetical protein